MKWKAILFLQAKQMPMAFFTAPLPNYYLYQKMTPKQKKALISGAWTLCIIYNRHLGPAALSLPSHTMA